MIIHGKEKESNTEDDSLYKELLELYQKENKDIETLNKIAKISPDDYSIMNKIKTEIKDKNLDLEVNLLNSIKFIKENPKSYIAWYHRKFLIDLILNSENMMSDNNLNFFKNEFRLISMCINLDTRNFHCWNYYRYLKNKIVKTVIGFNSIEKKFSDIIYEYKNFNHKVFNTNFGNYSALSEIINDGESNKTDLLQKLYTEPYDEGLWRCYEINRINEYFKGRLYYIKIFKNRFEIIFREPSQKIKSIYLNNKLLDFKIYDGTKILKFDYVVEIGDRIVVEKKVHYFEGKIKSYEKIVDEIINLDDSCCFPWYEKLISTIDDFERKEIIDKLVSIDEKRKNYYCSLQHEFFHII